MEDWRAWILWRRDGVHQHGLVDEKQRRIACPVQGCNVVRDVANPHLPPWRTKQAERSE